jgi:hypothetical protein
MGVKCREFLYGNSLIEVTKMAVWTIGYVLDSGKKAVTHFYCPALDGSSRREFIDASAAD